MGQMDMMISLDRGAYDSEDRIGCDGMGIQIQILILDV